MDYKEKYLKYKKKYINLKNQYGGVCTNCPKWGFKQHIGECWHDSFSTLLLYTDDLSEKIQEIFDNPEFNVDDIIEKAQQNPKWLIPINIEDSDYNYFIKNAKEYIINLKLRYDNQKAEEMFSKPPRDPRLRPKSKIGGVRPRRDSIKESINCSLGIYNISNTNAIIKKKYNVFSHGGNDMHFYNIINLFNYFLINYNKNIEEPLKIINNITIRNIHIFSQGDSFDMHCNYIENMIKKYLKDIQNSNSLQIIISLDIPKEYSKKIDVSNAPSHVICFFICNNKQYFYDDNGVDGQKDPEPENKLEGMLGLLDDKEEELYIEDFFEIDYPQLIEYTQNKKKQFIEYNWKDKIISSIIDILENDMKELRTLKDTDIDLINDKINIINNKLNSFYEDNKYKGEISDNYIGKKYLKYFKINQIDLIKIINIFDDSEYYKYVFNQTQYYNNKKSIDIIIKNIITDETIELEPFDIINFIIYKLERNDSKLLKIIEDKLLEKYIEHKDNYEKYNLLNNIIFISYKCGLFNIIKNISIKDEPNFDYKTNITIDTIINFISNSSYTDDYKLTEIENIHDVQKNNIIFAILNIFDIYNKNKEIIKEKKLNYLDEQIYFIHKIILSNFFDINHKIDDNNLLTFLYLNKDKDVDSIKIVLKNPRINVTNDRYVYFSIELVKKYNNIEYLKDILEHPNFNSDEYNKFIFKSGYNEFLLLDYNKIDDINKEIFDLMLDKNIDVNNILINDKNINLIQYIIKYTSKPHYYYLEKLINYKKLDINKLHLIDDIKDYSEEINEPNLYKLLMKRF
jgi:hypothetical protein